MTALSGPLFIACAMLALGGMAKATTPFPTRRALYAMGLPSNELLVRALGVGEIALAIATVIVGGALLPALVGAAYVAFAAFVVAALRNGKVASCGCFGNNATPPTALHIALNLALAGIAFAAIGTDPVGDVVADQPAAGVAFIGLVAMGTYATYLAFTLLPALIHPAGITKGTT